MRRYLTFVAAPLLAAGGVIAGVLAVGGTANSAQSQPPLPVTEQNLAAFDPFQIELFPKSQFCGEFTVPAGKRLVIEHVSANIEEGGSTFQVITSAGGATVDHLIVLEQPTGSNPVASQPVRFYADPGTLVSTCSGGLGVVKLSGHFVRLP